MLLRGPPQPPLETMVTALINELALLAGEVTMVLDDYHLIDSQPVHGSVTFLVERLPPGFRLVLASRADPPLSLARPRAGGWLAELRADVPTTGPRPRNDKNRREPMTDHKVVNREEWRAAREELLAAEKDHTRTGDVLARQRRDLPWVEIGKQDQFDTDDGMRTLAELFDGRS